ncbi:MAG: protein-glutamate O-methyltransferase CheR [Pseudomonadales bacterium]|nr:protein-glutamate O-methyltransferase CheR [Pseudomonadales bacterium]
MSAQAALAAPVLEGPEFERIRVLVHEATGIHLGETKQSMVAGRLGKRLKHLGLRDYGAYLSVITDDAAERQTALDLLTTNETYFFREPRHYDFVRETVLPAHPRSEPFRAWSAASSSGEEAYSLAMLLADRLEGGDWRILGSDISTQILEAARRAQYPMSRAERIPREYLKRFCLRGTGPHEGTFLVDRPLRARIEFRQVNLNASLPSLGPFDLILLRNVLIYFQMEKKREVVRRVVERLKPGGWFMVGHSESLHGVAEGLETVAPSIYRKPRE